MAKVRAYVYKVDGVFGEEYKVFPPVVVLANGDKFQLINTTDKDGEFSIPAGPFGAKIDKKKIDKKSGSTDLEAQNGPLGIEYEVKVDGKKATANSDPIIIIDP